jgi:hypothetical protein
VLRTSDGRLVVVGHPEATHIHADRHAHSHPEQWPIDSRGGQ